MLINVIAALFNDLIMIINCNWTFPYVCCSSLCVSVALFDATCTWSGYLQPRVHKVVNYSPKVFLGGIPWDISEQSLIQIFRQFGPIK